MNMVCYERGLLLTWWSVMNAVCYDSYELVCYEHCL